MRAPLRLLPAIALLAASSAPAAEPAPAAAPASPAVRMPEVQEFTLSNGMKFLVVRRDGAPIFHGVVTFRVGGVDDPKNGSGLAHLFEHMAFKGTRTIGTKDWAKEEPLLKRIEAVGEELTNLEIAGGDPKRRAELRAELDRLHAEHKPLVDQSEFWRIYDEAGGSGMNATTGNDRTSYFVSLPSNRLELWMLMESERLRDPVLREFYVERDVVPEERRMRNDTNPNGMLWEQLAAAAYTAHPYRVPVIGWMSDIQRLTMTQAKEFYRQFYSPDNAFGVLVGDVDPARVRILLERYFGRIPARGAPPQVATVEPPQKGERRVEVRFPGAPRLMMAWHKPCTPHPDDTTAEVVADLLGQGLTSRLHRRLVQQDRLARSAGAENANPGDRFPNLFLAFAEPLQGRTAAECEAAIDEEIRRLAEEGPTPAELARVATRNEVALLNRMDTNEGLARILAGGELAARDWRETWRFVERVKRTTPEDVKAFCARYLVRDNRTVAVLSPPEPAAQEASK